SVTGNGNSPQNGSYTFTNVAVTGMLNIDAGTSTAVALSVAATGDLPLGSVDSREGDVSVSASGSILDATGGLKTNLTGSTITIAAGSAIGSTSDYVKIDSSHSSPGLVNATSTGDLFLDQTTGSMTLGQVISSTGNVTLTAPASILDGSPTNQVALQGVFANLSAGSGIGTAAAPIQAMLGNVAADAGSGGIWINNLGAIYV